MGKIECFLEGHFYSGGLRYATFPHGSRPAWAPAQDSVGFRDEFELKGNDRAVEVRRFLTPAGRVTWVGVYFRSVDARHGDRRNHAGIGAWYLNAVPFELSELLAGLELLAKSISEDQDVGRIGKDAERFQTEFLPNYALATDELEPSLHFEFGDAGVCDTRTFSTHCAGPLATCARLPEHLLRVSYTDAEALPPRLVYHVNAEADGREDLAAAGAIGVQLLRWFPKVRALDRARAEAAETKAAGAEQLANDLQREVDSLKGELSEVQELRNDPQRLVLDELRVLSRKIDGLADRPVPQPNSAPPPYYPAFPVRGRGNRGPIQPPILRQEGPPEQASFVDALFPFALVAIVLAVIAMIAMLVWRYVPGLS